MVQSDPIGPPYRPIPQALEICIERHAEAWHTYRRASENYKTQAAENVTKARRALNVELYRLLDKIPDTTATSTFIPLLTPLPEIDG